MLCIDMCYGRLPEGRFVTGRKGRLTYVIASTENAANCAVAGFPNDAVFQFDDGVFTKLRSAFDRGTSRAIEKIKAKLR